ncbi:MAG: N-acetylneuraminate synthase family protein, partial [Planctomycetota bacterium]
MTKVVAEIGSNWEPGNLDSALAMVRLAAECGAGLVKFQDWGPLESFDRPQWWKEQSGKWTLPPEWFSILRAEADSCGVRFFTSVFTHGAVRRTGPHDFIKIASGEIGNQGIMRLINEVYYKPVFLSVPSTRQARVIPAMTWLNSVGLTLLHCAANDKGKTMYPADDMHLAQMNYLREFGLPVGFSSHLPYPQVIEA